MPFLKMLLKRVALLLVLYQLCRLTYLVFNYHYFAPISFSSLLFIMYGGIRFDLSALLYLNVVYLFLFVLPLPIRFNRIYQLTGKVIFILVNSIGIIANLIDCAYYPFILRRTSASFFLEFQNEAGLLMNIGKYIISYWYIVLLIVIFVWLLWKSYDWIKMPARPAYSPKQRWSPFSWESLRRGGDLGVEIAFLPVVFILWLGFARGSFIPRNQPLYIAHAGNYVKTPNEVNLVLNTPISIMSTWANIRIPGANYYASLDEAAKHYSPVQSYSGSPVRKKNVVILVVESLSREFIGALNNGNIKNYKSYTPFLDSLIPHSLTYRYAFANGRHSVEALPSVLSSIPSFTESYVLTDYATNNILSLPSVLKKRNYHTSFFHGGHEHAMGFSSFSSLAGIDHQFSKTDYNNDKDYDGEWGIYDENFMQYWAGRMNTFPQPFCSTLFTLSTHPPFNIPHKYDGKFNKGPVPIDVTIQYFDYALREFFDSVSKMPWYENTVFVITADHASPYQNYPEYYNAMGWYAIPVIFFTPDSSLTGFHETLAQQCDIYPTLLDYLGINDTILAFGESLLRNDPNHLVVNFSANQYQAFRGDWLLQFDGKEVRGLYRFKEDIRLQRNLMNDNLQEVKQLLPVLKAYIQQYSTRLRENRMLP